MESSILNFSEATSDLANLKFIKFLGNNLSFQNRTINYKNVYESLHKDIEDFNKELQAYNEENESYFNELISNIERIVKQKFPGDYYFNCNIF